MAKKSNTQNQNFAKQLANKLRQSKQGDVIEGAFSDGSCRWVNLKFEDRELCFAFDIKGKNIERIALYKNIVSVTDQVEIWGT